jgi:undecaprenyl-diphosphatase
MKHSPRTVPIRVLSWLGQHEMAVLLAFAALAAGILVFALITGEVMHGETQTFDRSLLLAMHVNSPELEDAARDVTALGGITALTLLTLFTGGYLLLNGRKHMGLFVWGAVVSGTLVDMLLKWLYQRPRPDLVPHGSYVSTTSFPSGHSMLSAVTYLTLGALLARSHRRKRLKAYFLLIAALLTILIGLSRVALGVHWPTDVLAGWTAGATWAIVCWLIARKLQLSHSIEPESDL